MFSLNKNIIKIFIFSNFYLLNLSPLFSQCKYKNCSQEKSDLVEEVRRYRFLKSSNNSKANLLAHQISNIDNIFLKNILIKDDIRLDHFFDLFISNNSKSEFREKLALEIESDKQYREDDIYYAEGNVIIQLKNGTLKADKFSYDKKNGKVKLIDNISFKKGNQYLKSSFINYDFNLKKGEIKNVSGFISIDNFGNDLNLYNIDKGSCNEEELNLLEIPLQLELLNTKNTRLNNIYGLTSDFGSISNWRFKSDRILLKNNSWTSEFIEFTNDPFENPQFIVESKEFTAEIIDNNYKFTSKSTSLNFENKLKIPIGNRTISSRDVSPNWGIGYDLNNWDGIYIYRNSDMFEITKNLSFSLKPFFLVQRAIRGKSSSFRLSNSSYLDDKVLQNINYADYLGLEGDIKANIFNWDSNVNMKVRSLNPNRLNDALSIDANISKTLYSSSNTNSSNSCSIKSQNPRKELSVKSGFYGVLLKNGIYSAYGTKLLTQYSFDRKNIEDDYSLILDVGNYKSKSSSEKQFLNLERYGINTNFNRSYRLFDLNKKDLFYDGKYNKTPNFIDKAFFINTKFSTSFYQYSNEKSQSIFLAGIGPSFTLGDLKNNFLDYSYLSVMPEFIIKKGKSPFAFDDFNSDSRIKFVYNQQLYGPIIFGLSSDLIISNKSNNYGNFTNIKYSMDISRRAYKISLFYKNDQSFGLNFNIFNFDTKFW